MDHCESQIILTVDVPLIADEVQWASLESHTKPPYTLTLKSNGCIIFIAALTPTRILVTSKHSTGPIQDREISHAGMGEIWLDRHLKTKGKKREQLAQVLWDNNWTAVAEVSNALSIYRSNLPLILVYFISSFVTMNSKSMYFLILKNGLACIFMGLITQPVYSIHYLQMRSQSLLKSGVSLELRII